MATNESMIAANQDAQLAIALSFNAWMDAQESARQKAIVRARKYYNGEQTAYLSARLKEFLDLDSAVSDDLLLHLNVASKVVDALVDRLNVSGFTSDDYGGAYAAFVWSEWQRARLDAIQESIYSSTLTDGEHFVIVEINSDGQLSYTAHPRYVESWNGGDDFGCKAFYPNDDESQPMLYAVKRWTENTTNERGVKVATPRATVYYPDHFRKFKREHGQWVMTFDEGDELDERGFVKNVDGQGNPLGIPVVHFRNRGLLCEIDSTVVSLQNAINKTLVDLLETADQSGFPIWLFFGFIPTSDGKALATDGSNRLSIKPNAMIATTAKPGEAAGQKVEASDPSPLIAIIEKMMRWLAQAKDIPVSRFQFTEQVAAEGTQKQQEAPMLARLSRLQVNFGDAWEDVFYLARKLANEFGGQSFDEEAMLQAQWASTTVRSDDRDNPAVFWSAASQAVAAGVPIETFLRRMGWTDADIGEIYEAQPNEQLTEPEAKEPDADENDASDETETETNAT